MYLQRNLWVVTAQVDELVSARFLIHASNATEALTVVESIPQDQWAYPLDKDSIGVARMKLTADLFYWDGGGETEKFDEWYQMF